MTRSVNSFGFAQIVNGPYARDAGMNGAGGALSPGNRANAVIGRALHLMLRNLGGAREGITVSQAQGNAMSWAPAFCENAADSPWPEMHTRMGYDAGESTVSLFVGAISHLGNFYYDDLPEIGRALASVDLPNGALVLLSAKRAAQLAAAGQSAEDVARVIEENATTTLGRFRSSGFFPLRQGEIKAGRPGSWPAHYLTDPDETVVPFFPPGAVHVAVVGSDVSSVVQAWLGRMHATARIDDWR